MGNLFELNDKIFEAMDELDAARGSIETKQAIDKARAKAELFGLVIKNASTIAKLVGRKDEAMISLGEQIGAANVLLGTPAIDALASQDGHAQALPKPDFDAAAWISKNGAGHSVSWIRDRLSKASGADYGLDEVSRLCEEAGVVPVKLGSRDMRTAEAERYAQMRRSEDGRD
jgi:hypothetical protein